MRVNHRGIILITLAIVFLLAGCGKKEDVKETEKEKEEPKQEEIVDTHEGEAISTITGLYIDEEIAKQSGVLQLGTKEQLTYSHNLTLLLSALGIFTLVLFIVINGICYLKASAKANALISPDLKTSLKLVFLAMVKNLPVYLLFTVAVVFIFALLEMYYARLKLIYLQGYILGQDIFNPSILFIIIRVYLVHIITYALGLFTYTALGFQNKICFKD